MGKEEKEETGFGFKDKAKAEETLRLLEAHDAGYRKLTVRGLLGRARRVLSLTKAEDKLKNIKEAMEVFENWLAELDGNKEKKPEREKKPAKKEEKSSGDAEKGKEEKEETGFGFKDKAKAEETLRLLEAHDAGYRRLTVRGLLGRARRVLTLTKAEDKLKNIKEAMEVFENWLAEQDKNKEKKPEAEKKPAKKEEKRSRDSPASAEEKDKTTKDLQELKLKDSKEAKSQDKMEHDGDSDDSNDGDTKRKDGDSKRKDDDTKNKDGGDKNRDGDKKERKRRSSARSDDESHSKKKKV